MSKQQFQTEVNQLLHLIIHSLYSNKEIFIRELISNASDALDKYKFMTLTNPKHSNSDFSPRVDINFVNNNDDISITISDNGIGMDKKDLNQIGSYFDIQPRFIVAILGNIMTMPGLPRQPAAEQICLNEHGEIAGLF